MSTVSHGSAQSRALAARIVGSIGAAESFLSATAVYPGYRFEGQIRTVVLIRRRTTSGGVEGGIAQCVHGVQLASASTGPAYWG